MCCREKGSGDEKMKKDEKKDKQTSNNQECLKEFMQVSIKLTLMMMRIADTPEVAMTLAQLGMRLNRTGTMASAPWSNLFPSTVERWL